MLSVAHARARARRRVETEGRSWAASGEDGVELSLPLHPPTERAVLADVRAALDWVASWRGIDGVQWSERAWPSVGRQRVPDRLDLQGPDAIAAFAGREALGDWKRLRERVRAVLAAFPEPASGDEALRTAVRVAGRSVAAMDEPDLQRLIALVDWFARHPDSGLRVRQVPVRGVHTKWLETHRSVVERLHEAVTGRPTLGIVPAAPVLVRLRVLDPALRPDHLVDLSLPIDELADWRPAAQTVLVVENLETLLALPDLEGVVAAFGGGYGAGPRFAPADWLRETDLVYWGDLDSHGFRILEQWRGVFPGTRGALMDEGTLVDHRDLWVEEPKPDTGAFSRLAPGERAALDRLRLERNARLEQERIPLEYALRRLDRSGPGPLGTHDDDSAASR